MKGSPMIRVPVEPSTVTVLGYKVKVTEPMWQGLDFDRAEPRQQASILMAMWGSKNAPQDIHLNVPFCHPEDRARGDDDDGCRYRVRPRMQIGKKWKGKMVKSAAFERWDGKWFIVIETAKE